MFRGAGVVVVALMVVALQSGCNVKKAPWEEVHPTSGTLTFGGKPVSGAQVTLFPTDSKVPESVRPTGVTEADGRFTISTFTDGDGAPAGEYRVSAIWHPVVHGPGGAVRGSNEFPVKYARPDTSGLTVKVEAGGGSLQAIDISAN